MERIADFVHEARSEDLGRGDLFAYCKRPAKRVALIRSKSDGVFAGEYYAEAIAKDAMLDIEMFVKDGDELVAGKEILRISGDDTLILQAERVLLNTLQHASGIATHTRKYADKLKGSGIALLDTRKTRPLLRRLEKLATRVGGAVNHRMGLDDCLMIKDTHLATIDDLAGFIKYARTQIPFTATIEIECEDIKTAKLALESGADIIMCDNMTLEMVKEVVALRASISPKTKVEASGNITLENIDRYKNTGVDAISTGSLIHQAVWLDFSMKMI